MEALARGGDAALDEVDQGLGLEDGERRVQKLLARVAREVGSSAAVAVLRRHVEHPDREVGLAVMRALAALGPQSHLPVDETDQLAATVVSTDLEYATHVLHAELTFENEPGAALLCAALRDEVNLVRQRILAGLAMRHGTAGLDRVTAQFAQRDDRSHALALEWLDVTLTGTERGVVAILDPGLSDRDRLGALGRWFPLTPLNQHDALLDLVEDREQRWRQPWIRACALYTAAGMPDSVADVLDAAESAALPTDDEIGIVRETLVAMRLGWTRQPA